MQSDPLLTDPRLPNRWMLAAVAFCFGCIAAASTGVVVYFIVGAAAGRSSHLLMLLLTLPCTVFLTAYFGFIAYGSAYYLVTGRRPPGRESFGHIADTLANTHVIRRRRRHSAT